MDETFGRYRLLSCLGRGGMAEVFQAKSFGVEGFEKVLVIKRILPALAMNPKFVELFVREAKLAVRLSHANIVQVFDLGRVESREPEAPHAYYIAMEYVPGVDLATLLARCRKQGRPVPFGLAVFVAAEVAKGLDHAHRRRDEQGRPLGVVHRDVSPQNVLLSWEGEVKVTDFGIAKAQEPVDAEEQADSRAGRLRGKLAYMSPEQARGEAVDARSDLFSLGTVLYETIAGQNPFWTKNAVETVRRVQAAEVPPLELVRPDIPRELSDVVKAMLERAPEARPQDAARVHELLLGLLYASKERFRASELAEFLAPFREEKPDELGRPVFEERSAASDVTPVEVPTNRSSPPSASPSAPSAEPTPARGVEAIDLRERRELTALVVTFFDTERAEAEAATAPFAQRALGVLERYGATIVERDEHQLAALFGLGDADGRDTDAAIRAALLLLRARSARITASVGIHVGRVVLAEGGGPLRDERLAELCGTAASHARAVEGGVAISRVAARVVRSSFVTEDVPASSGDRGGPPPEGARQVLGLRRPESAEERFVGRKAELKRLGDILALATRKGPQFVAIRGECGIGKSRLVAEMDRRIERGGFSLGFHVATCPLTGAREEHSGLTAMLLALCGLQEGDDEARVLDVVPRLRALGLRDDECDAILGQLGAGLPSVTDGAARGSPSQLRAAFARMAQRLGEDRVHVFVWDDAQFLDAASLEAIVAASTRPHLRGVFMLVTREEPPEALARLPSFHAIELGELDADDAARLLATRTNARSLPPELLELCRERAGGHPLFLEELVRELLDSGALSALSGTIKVRLDAAGTAAPRTLRTLLEGRVARLSPEERALLSSAAVLGDPIPTEVLATMLDARVAHVDRLVAALEGRGLLRTLGASHAAFPSPMHAEIVLDRVPTELRSELHARAALAYRAVFGVDAIEPAERVANHLYQSGARDEAASQFARAGQHRFRARQLEPSVRLMLRALELAAWEARTPSEAAQWIEVLTSAVVRVRHAPGLADALKAPLERIDARGSLRDRVQSRIHAARGLGSINAFDAAYALLEEAAPLASSADAPELRSELKTGALRADVELALRRGDIGRALAASAELERDGLTGSVRFLIALAHLRSTTGDPAGALAALAHATELAGDDDFVGRSEIEKQRVLCCIHGRDFAGAVAASARAVELTRAAGLRFELAAVLHNLGDARRRAGDHAGAYAALTDSLQLAQEHGLERLGALDRMHLAYLDALQGDEKAEGLLGELIRYAETRGYYHDAMEGRLLLGLTLHARGSAERARAELEEALRMADKYGDHFIAADAKIELAQMAAESTSPRAGTG